MTLDVYQEIAEVVRGKDIHLIKDEIYTKLNHTRQHASLAHCEGLRDQVIILNGFSNSYVMTGLRLGYILAQRDSSICL